MTLDVSQPSDTSKVSEWPAIIRTIAAAIAGSVIEANAQVFDAVDTDIEGSTIALEVLYLSGNAAASLHTITNGDEGRIKLVIAEDDNITLQDAIGNLSLRGNPLAPDLPMETGDMVLFLWDRQNNVWSEVIRALV